MRSHRSSAIWLAAVAAVAIVATSGTLGAVLPTLFAQAQRQQQKPPPPPPPGRTPDVIFVPTRTTVVNAMFKMANVTKNDVVYDLGCGDGAFIVAAGKLGARAVGVDIDPQRVKEARANVEAAGVQDRVTVIHGDIFDPRLNISEATVVTLYLLPGLNAKLAPRLKKELKPGTRIVSHSFDMSLAEPPWEPEKHEVVDGFTNIYMWTIK